MSYYYFLLSKCHTTISYWVNVILLLRTMCLFIHLLYNSNYSNWVLTISFELCYPITLVNALVFQNNNWLNTQLSALLCCPGFTVCMVIAGINQAPEVDVPLVCICPIYTSTRSTAGHHLHENHYGKGRHNGRLEHCSLSFL